MALPEVVCCGTLIYMKKLFFLLCGFFFFPFLSSAQVTATLSETGFDVVSSGGTNTCLIPDTPSPSCSIGYVLYTNTSLSGNSATILFSSIFGAVTPGVYYVYVPGVGTSSPFYNDGNEWTGESPFALGHEYAVRITSPLPGEVTATTTIDVNFEYYVGLPGTFVLNLETYENCLGTPEESRYELDTGTLGVATSSFDDLVLEGNKTYYATVRYLTIFEDEGDPQQGLYSSTILFHSVSTSTAYLTDESAFTCSLARVQNRLKYKMPWGYYFLFQTQIEEMKKATSTQIIAPLATITSTDTFGNLHIPDIVMLNTAWFSEDSEFLGGIWPTWQFMNTVLGWLCWLWFAWWIIQLADREKDNLK